ncbi:kelch repeat-containing protein [Cupriavidus basilensis]|uniref:kelch repeat-containing protein n=1 Tax=Cupriavidus basilensis TaxID=68895 RepID=UPI001300C490|nr:kelch repeat-containing protein [Cupriavidus basilensis]
MSMILPSRCLTKGALWNMSLLLVRQVVGLLLILSMGAGQAMAAAPATAPGQSATSLPDGRWLLLGGEGDGAGKAVVLNSVTQQLVVLSSRLRTPRSHHSGTLLPDGKVLVFGGVDSNGAIIRDAELFDPVTQAFTSLGDLGLIPRARHTATVLMDGSVLIAGGTSEQGGLLIQADLWDPVSRQAQGVHAQMVVPRADHTAQLLADEPILLSGGRDGAGKSVTSPELYFPQQQRFGLPDQVSSGWLATAASTSAPSVQESMPAPDAINVSIKAKLAVRFSKPLAVASLNARTVTLLGPTGSVAAAVVPVEGGRLLFVTPEVELRPGARYTLFINAALDEAGTALPFTAIGFTAESLHGSATAAGVSSSAAPTAVAQTVQPNAGSGRAVAQPASPAPAQPALPATPVPLPDAVWIPGPTHMRGNWQVKQPASPLQQLPPLAATTTRGAARRDSARRPGLADERRGGGRRDPEDRGADGAYRRDRPLPVAGDQYE